MRLFFGNPFLVRITPDEGAIGSEACGNIVRMLNRVNLLSKVPENVAMRGVPFAPLCLPDKTRDPVFLLLCIKSRAEHNDYRSSNQKKLFDKDFDLKGERSTGQYKEVQAKSH